VHYCTTLVIIIDYSIVNNYYTVDLSMIITAHQHSIALQSAVIAMVNVSVRLSVCPPHAGIVYQNDAS